MSEDVQEVEYEEPQEAPQEAPVEPSPELDLTDVVTEAADAYQGELVGEQPQPGFLDYLGHMGFSDVQSVEDGQSRLLDSYIQAQQVTDHLIQQNEHLQQSSRQAGQMADYGQRWMEMQSDPRYQAFIQQQQQPPPEPEAPEGWWAPPEVDQEEVQRWRHQVRDPQTGSIYWDWRPDTPHEVRNATEKYVGYVEKWTNDLTSRPQEVFPRIIEQEFDRLFQDRMSNLYEAQTHQWQQAREQGSVENINQRNADWLYEYDPRTRRAYTDNQGQPVMSREGQEVTRYVRGLRQSGMTDPDQIWNVATQMMAGRIATGLVASQQQGGAASQRNVEHLQRGAGHIPDRSGSVPTRSNPSPRSQNRHVSAGEKLRQQALADGLF